MFLKESFSTEYHKIDTNNYFIHESFLRTLYIPCKRKKRNVSFKFIYLSLPTAYTTRPNHNHEQK